MSPSHLSPGELVICHLVICHLLTCHLSPPGLSYTRGELLQEVAAPLLVLLQHSLATGKLARGEVGEEVQQLVAMVEEAREHMEVFEEGREEQRIATVRSLLEDVRSFHQHITAAA